MRFGCPLEVSAVPLWQGPKLKQDGVENMSLLSLSEKLKV